MESKEENNNHAKINESKKNSKSETTDDLNALAIDADTKAKGYFREGLNCAECVLLTYIDLIGTELPPEIMRLATGFGGGMGRTKNTCGAVTGAVMALGLSKGRPCPFAKETPSDRARELSKIYEPYADMVNEIKDNFGSLICSELSNPHGDFEGKERRKNCQHIVGYCAALAVKYGSL